MNRPAAVSGLHHIALRVEDSNFAATVDFYTRLVGMAVEWQPDADNVYLCSGTDNLALHRVADGALVDIQKVPGDSSLDHIGILLQRFADVDDWYRFMLENDIRMIKSPKTHRDGARSFYCCAPDGTVVQFLFHPPLSPPAD